MGILYYVMVLDVGMGGLGSVQGEKGLPFLLSNFIKMSHLNVNIIFNNEV